MNDKSVARERTWNDFKKAKTLILVEEKERNDVTLIEILCKLETLIESNEPESFSNPDNEKGAALSTAKRSAFEESPFLWSPFICFNKANGETEEFQQIS